MNAQIRFETRDGIVAGTTNAVIKKVEQEDDGTTTYVVDAWPQQGILDGIERVREFHAKHGFWGGKDDAIKFEPPKSEQLRQLLDMTHYNLKRGSERMMEQFHQLLHESDKCLALRWHLIDEECAEGNDAASDGDEVRMLDALADMLYVIFGTAVAYDLPLAAAFYEVHRSNMTKQRVEGDRDKERLRDKGPDWQPPDLKRILRAHRNQRQMEAERAFSTGPRTGRVQSEVPNEANKPKRDKQTIESTDVGSVEDAIGDL
jgi:predicted HAD superfamily Cof-like phosphohydrolase